MLTKFEKARVLAARTLQLAYGAPPLIKVKDVYDPYEVAKEEFEKGVLPFVILRVYPNGKVERVEVS